MGTDKEYYLYTYQELIEKIGPQLAKEKAQFYKKDFLVKYPKTMCVLNGPLLKTYKEEAKGLRE